MLGAMATAVLALAAVGDGAKPSEDPGVWVFLKIYGDYCGYIGGYLTRSKLEQLQNTAIGNATDITLNLRAFEPERIVVDMHMLTDDEDLFSLYHDGPGFLEDNLGPCVDVWGSVDDYLKLLPQIDFLTLLGEFKTPDKDITTDVSWTASVEDGLITFETESQAEVEDAFDPGPGDLFTEAIPIGKLLAFLDAK